MKKLLSVLAAGFLLASALAAFTGCGASELKDEALVEKIYEAIETAEIEQCEITTSLKGKNESIDMTAAIKSSYEIKSISTAYTMDGEYFADMFTEGYTRTESKSAVSKVTTTKDTYQMDFVRGGETYSAAGEWKSVDAKKGNFTALIEEMKSKDKQLSGSYTQPSADFSEGDVQTFGELAREIDAKAYRDGSGYLVKLEAQALMEHGEEDFLEDLIGVDGNEDDFGGDIKIYLDGKFNVTQVVIELEVSVKENPSVTSQISTGAELKMVLKVLTQAPQLTDLTGLKANMGTRYTPGEYPIPKSEAYLYIVGSSARLGGYCYGTATVTDNQQLILEITYEEKNGAFSVSEHREYSLLKYNSDSHDLFDNWELPNGQRVESYGGLSLRLLVRPSDASIELKVMSNEVNITAVKDYIKILSR